MTFLLYFELSHKEAKNKHVFPLNANLIIIYAYVNSSSIMYHLSIYKMPMSTY